MTQFYNGPTSRLQAIISGGWGTTSTDATVANRSIPAGRWLPTVNNSPVEDVLFTGGRFDRAYVINWTGDDDLPLANDPFQNTLLVRAECVIDIGYVYGYSDQMSAQVNVDAGTTETAESALATVRSRALSDGRRIWRALNLTTMLANNGTNDINPIITGVTKNGRTSFSDIGRGRLVFHIPLWVDLQGDATENYDP